MHVVRSRFFRLDAKGALTRLWLPGASFMGNVASSLTSVKFGATLLLALWLATFPVQAQSITGVWRQLQADDLALATALFRLATANTQVCTDHVPATGLVLISPSEFPVPLRPSLRQDYALVAPMAVEAVVPGSPAELAGVIPGSGLVAIGDTALPVTRPDGHESLALQNNARAALESVRPGQPITLTLDEHGTRVARTLIPRAACGGHAELLTDNGLTAQSDDTSIQISTTFLVDFGPDALPVLISHELAHIILHHTQRLSEQHVNRGLLRQFGRNAIRIREAEDEADRLSVHLLANAGYDPGIAPRFWLHDGNRLDGGLLRSPTHSSSRHRAKAMLEEIATLSEQTRCPTTNRLGHCSPPTSQPATY